MGSILGRPQKGPVKTAAGGELNHTSVSTTYCTRPTIHIDRDPDEADVVLQWLELDVPDLHVQGLALRLSFIFA